MEAPERDLWASSVAWASFPVDYAMGKVELLAGRDYPMIVVLGSDLARMALYSWCRVLGQA